MTKKPYVPELLLKKYEAGLSLKDLEKLTKISSSELSRQLRKLNPNYTKAKTYRPHRKEAFLLYIQGHSLRALSRKLGLHHTTCHRWFRAMSPSYATVARQGIFASTGEFLSSKQARARPDEALRVRDWLLTNLPKLIQSESTTETVSFSSAKENRLRKTETSRYSDFRETIKG